MEQPKKIVINAIGRRNVFFVLVLTILLSGITPHLIVAGTITESLQVTSDSIQLVGRQTVGRTHLDYIYTANIQNSDAKQAINVTVMVSTSQLDAEITQNTLNFAAIASGETITSQNEFVVRVPRRSQVDLTALQFNITGDFVNKKPVANAGFDQSLFLNDSVQLDGSTSSDMDGDQLSYQWTFLTRPQDSQAILTGADSLNPTFTIDLPGRYEIELIVNDGTAESAPDTVVIATQNSKPVAKAGLDQSLFVGDIVQLDGISSHDADSDPLTFQWSLPIIPEGSLAVLNNPALIDPLFTIDLPGSYHAQLQVDDGTEISDSDTVIITTLNSKPVASAGADQTAFVGDTINLDGQDSSDSDNDALTFEWSLISRPVDSSSSIVNPFQEQTSFVPDNAGIYVAQLIVRDTNLTSDPDTTKVTVEVLNTNTPPVANAGTDLTAVTGQQVTLDGSLSFDPDGNSITYNWVLIKPNGSIATLSDPTSEQPSFTPDNAGTYTGQLLVNDGTVNSLSDAVGIFVTANASPVINSTPITNAIITQAYRYDVNASDADGHVLSYSLVSFPANMTIDINTGLISWTPETAGDFPVTVKVTDEFREHTTQSFTISVQADNSGLPSDPETVAPTLDQTITTDTFEATQFLYTGTDPIQTGVIESTIEANRVAVIRGKVLDKQNNPLSGVTISIHNHPEFGQTLSRADGMFDMAINGGGVLTVDYQKTGYLPSQRTVKTPWKDYVLTPNVVLLQLDNKVTTINLDNIAQPFQVARGNVVTDLDGIRQATVLFPQGLQAEMLMPDGTLQPLTTLNVRATEYTVADNGLESMPGELPPTSAYTYAVELSVDEAIVAGATTVNFDRPIPFYVDNFLNMPIGIAVPIGFYDRNKAAWIPQPDGRVLKVLNINAGIAEIDSTGDGLADNGIEIGMDAAEREKMGALYTAGTSLWRSQHTHFSTYDHNYGVVPEAGAEPPSVSGAENEQQKQVDDPDIECNSIIECQNQVLGETIPLTGSSLTLNYRSDRVSGRKVANTLKIRLSNATIPAVLKRIELEINIAGREFKQSFPAVADQFYTFNWDKKDIYGREIQGAQLVTIRIGYVYDGFYSFPPNLASSFGSASGEPIPDMDPARQEVILWQDSRSSMGGVAFKNLGGWDLSVHHVYDPEGQVLYLGNGSKRSANSMGTKNIIRSLETELFSPFQMAFAPDGRLFIADFNRVLQVGIEGTISTVAGGGESFIVNDGDLATESAFVFITGIAIGQNNDFYIFTLSFSGVPKIYHIDENGIITIIAGIDVAGFGGDGGPAKLASLNDPFGIALAPDGSLYIADSGNHRIRRIDPEGIISTVAGSENRGFSGDYGSATQALLKSPYDIVIGADGSLYIADTDNRRIRRVTPDGIITTVAGNGFTLGSLEVIDGEVATQVAIGSPFGITIGLDGHLYFSTFGFPGRVYRVDSSGIITTVAGGGGTFILGDNGPATKAALLPWGLATGLDGNIYIADRLSRKIRIISSAYTKIGFGSVTLSSKDGSQLYVFSNGRHTQTFNTLTGEEIYDFSYDTSGQLIAITDADNNITTIERDSLGNLTAIIAPFGQKTTLTLDTHGYLASVTNPSNEKYQMTYTAEGLLTEFKDPLMNATSFSYDPLGFLLTDTNAEGGFFQLTRTDDELNYEVAVASALNRITTHRIENLLTGDQKRIDTAPDGTVIEKLFKTDGSRSILYPDNTSVNVELGPDPRFGMQSPLLKTGTVSSGGLTTTVAFDRAVDLSDPDDPLSLISITDQLNINGKILTSTYDALTRTYTNTSPVGRQSSRVVNAQGRVTQVQVNGLSSVFNSYDVHGRLKTTAFGTGADERLTTFAYNPAGFLSSFIDPLGQTTNFQYDLTGRVTKQTLPDSREILYSYDANGNLTSLTPPGRPAHGFNYTAINQTETYTPPDIGIGQTSTTYQYNLDKQMTTLLRPDGQNIVFAYDAVTGKLNQQTTPLGDTLYGYETTTGKLISIDTSDGQGLTYSFNGALPTQVDWSGSVTGNVGFSYDNDFRIASINVNAANSIAYGYDNDSLLTQAGDLTLSRDALNGLLTATTLNLSTDTYTHNSFGEVTNYLAQYNSADLLGFQYNYDKLGRITQKQETESGVTDTFDYAYDTAGRLTEVKKNNVMQSSYAYDGNGNRTTVNGAVIATYDNQDRLLTYGSTGYNYNANGELQSKTESGVTTNYSYDVLGNLRQVILPGSVTIDYLIDGQNRRVGKKVNGTLTQGFLYQDQLNPIAELDASGNVVSRFIYADKGNVPAYMVKGGITYRIISNHLG